MQDDFNEKLAEINFQVWNKSLQSLDPKIVANLYTDDATFLPTLSSDFKIGKSGAESYFTHFLEKFPAGTVLESKMQPICEEAFLHSGLYDFEVGSSDARNVVHARFTFLWMKNSEGNWQIAHHHSSLLPQT